MKKLYCILLLTLCILSAAVSLNGRIVNTSSTPKTHSLLTARIAKLSKKKNKMSVVFSPGIQIVGLAWTGNSAAAPGSWTVNSTNLGGSNLAPNGFNVTFSSGGGLNTPVNVQLTLPSGCGLGNVVVAYFDGSYEYSATFTIVGDFSLIAAVPNYLGNAGEAVSGTYSITSINGYTGTVALSSPGMTFVPTSGTSPFSGTFSGISSGGVIYVTGTDSSNSIVHIYAIVYARDFGGYTNNDLITINPAIIYNPSLNQNNACNVDGVIQAFPVSLVSRAGTTSVSSVPNNSTSFNVQCNQVPTASSPRIVSCLATSGNVLPASEGFQLYVYSPSGNPNIPPGNYSYVYWQYSTINFNGATIVPIILIVQSNQFGTINLTYTVPSGFTLLNLPASVSAAFGVYEYHFAGLIEISGNPIFPAILTVSAPQNSANVTLVNNPLFGAPPNISTTPVGVPFPNTVTGFAGPSQARIKRPWLKK